MKEELEELAIVAREHGFKRKGSNFIREFPEIVQIFESWRTDRADPRFTEIHLSVALHSTVIAMTTKWSPEPTCPAACQWHEHAGMFARGIKDSWVARRDDDAALREVGREMASIARDYLIPQFDRITNSKELLEAATGEKPLIRFYPKPRPHYLQVLRDFVELRMVETVVKKPHDE